MRVLLILALLLSTQYGIEFNFDKKTELHLNLSSSSKTDTTSNKSMSSKRQFIINEIKDIEHDIESFPLKLQAFQTQLTEMNTKNLKILKRIDNHLLIVNLADSDNPTVRKRADVYIDMKFGTELSNMKQEVKDMIKSINQKIDSANTDVNAISGLIIIRDGYKAQLALMD